MVPAPSTQGSGRYDGSDSDGEHYDAEEFHEEGPEGDMSTDIDPGVVDAGARVSATAAEQVTSPTQQGAHPVSPAPASSPSRAEAAPGTPLRPPSQPTNPDPFSQSALPDPLPSATPARSHPPTSQPPLPTTSVQALSMTVDKGLEFTRASTIIMEQQEQVEVLEQRLLAAAAARDRAQAALLEQAREHQAAEERQRALHESQLQEVTSSYEAQLASHRQELAVALAKVERLEQQVRLTEHKAKPGASKPSEGGAEVTPGVSELESEVTALKREVAEQERLLAGYQHENQAATKRIKELEAALKESTTARYPVLSSITQDPSLKASTQEVAARLTEVLALQQQLEGVREAASVREAEMKAIIDKLRAEKRELEARRGGVDLKANQEGDVLVAKVQQEMEAMRSQYQEAITELQTKLRWYIENQELLSSQDHLVKEQQGVINQLEHRLAVAEGPEGRAAAQKVAELQAQVSSLQQALKSKGLNKSLAAVIEAAKPSPAESSAVAALQRQVDQLSSKLAAKDEDYELQLRSYQQQYEALRLQFEERQTALTAQLKGKTRKEAPLATQLEEQRSMYMKQIKDLKIKLQLALSQQPQPAPTPAQPPASPTASSKRPAEPQVPASVLRAKELEVARLQQELQRKTKQVAELHLKLGEAEARVVRLGHQGRASQPPSLNTTPARDADPRVTRDTQDLQRTLRGADGRKLWRIPGESPTAAATLDRQPFAYDADLEVEVDHLRQQNAALSTQVAVLNQQVAMAAQQVALVQAQGAIGAGAAAHVEVEALKRKADAAELAMLTIQKSHTEAVEKCALLQAEHQRALLRLQDEVSHQEASKWRQRLSSLESDLQAARSRVSALEAELADKARAQHAWAPQTADFLSLERKLETMAQEAQAREAKWREVLQDTQQLYQVQSELAQKKWEASLAGKNAELGMLKSRVDELLTAAARLHANNRAAPA